MIKSLMLFSVLSIAVLGSINSLMIKNNSKTYDSLIEQVSQSPEISKSSDPQKLEESPQ